MNQKSRKILVVGGMIDYYKPFKFMYNLSTDIYDFINNPKLYDLVLFTGGEDVSPHLYGDDTEGNMIHNSEKRDETESRIFHIAKKNFVKMTGICRGIQFLNVMHGGRMLHDVKNHGGHHLMKNHKGPPVQTNSLHHQVCIPPKNSYVIGWVENSDMLKTYGNHDVELKWWPRITVEALFFPETKSYGVQYHPEMMPHTSEGFAWFQELIADMECMKETCALLKKWTHVGLLEKEADKEEKRLEAVKAMVYGY